MFIHYFTPILSTYPKSNHLFIQSPTTFFIPFPLTNVYPLFYFLIFHFPKVLPSFIYYFHYYLCIILIYPKSLHNYSINSYFQKFYYHLLLLHPHNLNVITILLYNAITVLLYFFYIPKVPSPIFYLFHIYQCTTSISHTSSIFISTSTPYFSTLYLY